MAREFYSAVFSGHDGRGRGDVIKVMQNAIETDLVFDCVFEDDEEYTFAAGDVVSAFFFDINDESIQYQSIGTFTPDIGTNRFTWDRDASDVGTPAAYSLAFKVVSGTAVPDFSIVVDYIVSSVPTGTVVPLPPGNVGVTPAEKAWLSVQTVNGENVADKEDSLGNPTSNGWVLSSTIAGVRSWIAQAVSSWGNITGTLSNQTDLQSALNAKVSTVDLSDAPVGAEALQADGSGGLSLKSLIINALTATTKGLLIKLAAASTENALEIQDSTSAVIMRVDESGRSFAFGGTLTRPGYAFSNGVNGDKTGIYYDGSGLVFVRNEAVVATYSTIVTFALDVQSAASAAGYKLNKGTANGSPVHAFRNDSDSGLGNAGVGTASLFADGTEIIRCTDDSMEIKSIKSGATQGAAGATADEVWKTASHATLPDNVLMIGV